MTVTRRQDALYRQILKPIGLERDELARAEVRKTLAFQQAVLADGSENLFREAYLLFPEALRRWIEAKL